MNWGDLKNSNLTWGKLSDSNITYAKLLLEQLDKIQEEFNNPQIPVNIQIRIEYLYNIQVQDNTNFNKIDFSKPLSIIDVKAILNGVIAGIIFQMGQELPDLLQEIQKIIDLYT